MAGRYKSLLNSMHLHSGDVFKGGLAKWEGGGSCKVMMMIAAWVMFNSANHDQCDAISFLKVIYRSVVA